MTNNHRARDRDKAKAESHDKESDAKAEVSAQVTTGVNTDAQDRDQSDKTDGRQRGQRSGRDRDEAKREDAQDERTREGDDQDEPLYDRTAQNNRDEEAKAANAQPVANGEIGNYSLGEPAQDEAPGSDGRNLDVAGDQDEEAADEDDRDHDSPQGKHFDLADQYQAEASQMAEENYGLEQVAIKLAIAKLLRELGEF